MNVKEALGLYFIGSDVVEVVNGDRIMVRKRKRYKTGEELYLDNEKLIFRYIASYATKNCLSAHDRDELVSQVWYKVTDKLDTLLEMDIPAVCTYIKSIANSVVVDDFRARTKTGPMIEYVDPEELEKSASEASSIEEELFDVDMESYARKTLVLLNIEDRRLVQLYYCEGLTAKKLGELMGLTEGAVRMRLNRIKQKMQKICQEEMRKGEGYLD